MKINSSQLLEALTKVKPGLSNNEIIEQAMHFCFQDGIVRTYNDQIAITCPIDIEIQGAVGAENFFKLITKLEKKDEEIEITVKNEELSMKAGKTKAMIKMLPDVKLIDIDTDIGRWNPLPQEFLDAVKFCSFSTSTDLADSEFTCLYVSDNTIISCDTFRATKMTLSKKMSKPFLLPAKVAKELLKYPIMRYAIHDNWIHFKDVDDVIFSCREVSFEQNKLQNIDAFFEIEGDKVTLPDNFKEVVDRAQSLTDEAFDQEKSVEIIVKKGEIICRGESDSGWVEETAKTDYKGKQIKVSVHPECLMEILDHLRDVVIGESTLLFEGDDFQHVVKLQIED